jgi:hypothetical protein
MNEAEWLAATDPKPMLEFLRVSGRASPRKLRLLTVACCRRVRDLLVPEAWEALEVAERVAEGTAGPEERKRVRSQVFHAGWVSDPSTAHRRGPAKAAVCDSLARRAGDAAAGVVLHLWWPKEMVAQVRLLHDVFGNPFRQPPSVKPTWLDWNGGTVRGLAEAAYEQRSLPEGTLDSTRLAVLADALEEAGCTDRDILGHFREQGAVHVPGCWCLDLLLTRS